MKIGIITFTYGCNYGNKLQNYALLKVLEKEFGKEVYTMRNFDITTKGNLKTRIKSFIKFILAVDGERQKVSKQKKFDNFSEKNLNFYPIALTENTVDKLQDFDAFVCGSDQIWNPYYNKDMYLFTAAFAEKAKRTSYAASIGLDKLPLNLEQKYSENISTMDYIGVREQEAAKLIKDLTERDADVQIDPTMLLTQTDWTSFSKKPDIKVPDRYVLTYFVRSMSPSAVKVMEELKTEENIDVINLNDTKNKEWYDLDPREFVWLIKNAEYVLADSFHATVFSILFHKPFHCFERQSGETINRQESRLKTLLSYFNLDSCISETDRVNWEQIDFSETDNILNRKRQQSMESLRLSLK